VDHEVTRGRGAIALAFALVVGLAAAAGLVTAGSNAVRPGSGYRPGTDHRPGFHHRPNVIVVLTDDQSLDTLPHDPPVMPWLQSQIQDPSGHWQWFPDAVFDTPLCCPSRATILTGQYSHHTGVVNNDTGHLLNESNTLAVWLHDSGYTTGLIGKYLNLYPFGRGNYVPAGWDRWFAKLNESASTTYFGYDVVDQGVLRSYGHDPTDYVTRVLTQQAVDFVRTAPTSEPFFLYFTPPAPHFPWTPAPGDAGAYQGGTLVPPPADTASVIGMPDWVRALPPPTAHDIAVQQTERRRQYDTLLGVDRSVHDIVDAVAARGDLSNTYIFFLTDNGYSFGEHRIVGKRCPYEECIRTPFAVYVPGGESRTDPHLVSNVDLAPTIAALAGVTPKLPEDGSSFARSLVDPAAPVGHQAKLIEWAGDPQVPPWWGVRTPDFAYIETGSQVELYDLTGRLGSPDPHELHNVAALRVYAEIRARLAARLLVLRDNSTP
jgi:N-acetylglucosamine-6-sulfatase